MAAAVKHSPRGIALAIAAVAVFGAVVFASSYAWRWYRMPERVQAALPAQPDDLDSKSAELKERVVKAEALTSTRSDALGGVEQLGCLYHANGYLRQAEACWEILRAEEPKNPKWAYYLADLRRTAGDGDGYSALLKETVRLDPGYATAWLKLADYEFKTGQAAAAEIHYRKRLALVPKDPYARLGLARIATQRGDKSAARKAIEEIVADAPDFPPAQNLLAEMLAAEGKTDEAFRHRNLGREAGRFREATDPWIDGLADWCFDPKRLALLSTMASQTGLGERGESLLKRAIKIAPDDPASYDMLGILYLQLGRPVEAQAVFEKALSLQGDGGRRVMMTVNLAESLRLQKRSGEALPIVRAGLSRFPKSYELHNELGAILVDLGRIEESVPAYRDAIAIAPNDADSNFSLGSSLLALGHVDEAITYLKQSLTLQPTFPKALVLLGRIALERGDLDEAREYLQPLFESHPEQPLARELFARYYLRAGEAASARKDSQTAERLFRKGLAVEPNLPELNASLGVLCLVQGRIQDALAPFEAFHRLRPQDPQSSLFLGQLYAQLGRFAEARQILAEGKELAERAGNKTTAQHCSEILGMLPPGR